MSEAPPAPPLRSPSLPRLPPALASLPAVHLATRSYGTSIYRLDDGRRAFYLKATTPPSADDWRFSPRREADRLVWLAGHGFPVPEVVDIGENADVEWLVTTALDGVPAARRWSPGQRGAVVDLVAELARSIHKLPVEDCPFDRGLAMSLRYARTAVRMGAVDLDDLDDDHRGWTAARLLAEIEARVPPDEDEVVVCHGDLCLDNVLVAPERLELAGVLDVGRLGRADRYVDLSVVLRNIGEECRVFGFGGADASRFLRRYGIDGLADAKLDYYRLLDEFI